MNVTCFQNNMQPINTLCGQNIVLSNIKVGGTYKYHFTVSG